jgi:predicted unusual protein kinase regulating ubiquinone biosynthesis (AarF/ABC1/UbiB family)
MPLIPPRLGRWLAVTTLAARIYGGYKAITVRENRLGEQEAERRRIKHNAWSANHYYNLAVDRQGLLIKLGQVIGSRPDLIPEEYTNILSRLQDAVPPRPFPIIKRRVERQLERPITDVFSDFEETPIASASLAQVHRARLKQPVRDHTDVAVKVQYPGIDTIVHQDLANVRFLMRILGIFERNLDFTPIVEELSHNVPMELDFINEGHSAETIARNFAEREDIIVPDIIWEYSTRRVLTMEYTGGVKITDLEGMAREGINPQEVSQLVTDAYCEQLYLHGMFHADPHPGNFFVRPGPKLVMLDFGLCRQLDDKFRIGYARLTESMLTWNISEMIQAYKDLGIKVKNADDPAVYLELGRAFTDTSLDDRAYADRDLVEAANERLKVAVRNNPITEIPRELLLIMRVTGLLSGLGKYLDSRVDVTNTLLPYVRAAQEGAR